jgi:hypothetical protein
MLKRNGMALDGADEGYNSGSAGRGILQNPSSGYRTRSRILPNRGEHRTRHKKADGNETQAC